MEDKKKEFAAELAMLTTLGLELSKKRKEAVMLDGQLNDRMNLFMKKYYGVSDEGLTLPQIISKSLELNL